MRTATLLSGALLVAAALGTRHAGACGGCFQPPSIDAVVTGHRMAFAVSEGRTVLWDQIQYSGNPGDFGWVLPVAPGATIELSSDAWFESLETVTATRVTAPALNCLTSGNGSGCLSSSINSAADLPSSRDIGGANTIVLRQASLGPFETVTLRSTDAGSLRTWLSSHGFSIQSDVDPIIDAYIDEGMDFIALRLRGSQPMQPVRVVTPSGKAVLPLRMVMAGTGSSVDVVLYVIGEQRLGLADLTETHLDTPHLTFDFVSGTSNYESLRQTALEENLGATFLTTFASKNPFDKTSSSFFVTTNGSASATTLGQLYFAQGAEDAGRQADGCSLALRGLTSDTLVSDDQDALEFGCGDLTDIAAAMVGMHPSRVWLSRLEMTLPREALSMDCRVNADDEQTEVSNDLTAGRGTSQPSYCLQPLFESRLARERSSPALSFAWAIGAVGLVGLLRRVRGRR